MTLSQTSALFSALLFVAGCSSSHQYSTSRISTPVRNPADVAIETGVRADLNRYGDLFGAASDIQVNAYNGTVTLTGPAFARTPVASGLPQAPAFAPHCPPLRLIPAISAEVK
jgi:osmotically-inducible protein OsmY